MSIAVESMLLCIKSTNISVVNAWQQSFPLPALRVGSAAHAQRPVVK